MKLQLLNSDLTLEQLNTEISLLKETLKGLNILLENPNIEIPKTIDLLTVEQQWNGNRLAFFNYVSFNSYFLIDKDNLTLVLNFSSLLSALNLPLSVGSLVTVELGKIKSSLTEEMRRKFNLSSMCKSDFDLRITYRNIVIVSNSTTLKATIDGLDQVVFKTKGVERNMQGVNSPSFSPTIADIQFEDNRGSPRGRGRGIGRGSSFTRSNTYTVSDTEAGHGRIRNNGRPALSAHQREQFYRSQLTNVVAEYNRGVYDKPQPTNDSHASTPRTRLHQPLATRNHPPRSDINSRSDANRITHRAMVHRNAQSDSDTASENGNSSRVRPANKSLTQRGNKTYPSGPSGKTSREIELEKQIRELEKQKELATQENIRLQTLTGARQKQPLTNNRDKTQFYSVNTADTTELPANVPKSHNAPPGTPFITLNPPQDTVYPSSSTPFPRQLDSALPTSDISVIPERSSDGNRSRNPFLEDDDDDNVILVDNQQDLDNYNKGLTKNTSAGDDSSDIDSSAEGRKRLAEKVLERTRNNWSNPFSSSNDASKSLTLRTDVSAQGITRAASDILRELKCPAPIDIKEGIWHARNYHHQFQNHQFTDSDVHILDNYVLFMVELARLVNDPSLPNLYREDAAMAGACLYNAWKKHDRRVSWRNTRGSADKMKKTLATLEAAGFMVDDIELQNSADTTVVDANSPATEEAAAIANTDTATKTSTNPNSTENPDK